MSTDCPPTASLPGREYFLERDCYLFKFRRENSDWPLIASRLSPFHALPDSVDQPRTSAAIFEVSASSTSVKAGTRFRIVSVRRTASPVEDQHQLRNLARRRGQLQVPAR
jgi:hypothetical protein